MNNYIIEGVRTTEIFHASHLEKMCILDVCMHMYLCACVVEGGKEKKEEEGASLLIRALPLV